MRLKHQWWSILVAAVLSGLMGVTAVAAAGAQFLPVLGIREGALRSSQIPIANGYIDYVTLLNVRDGGVNGVPLVWEECETVGDISRGVECYERLKARGPTGAAVFHLPTTTLAYAVTERVTQDRIPLLTLGYGRSDAADGRVFPYVFNPPVTYWSQNTAKIRFMGQRVGGMDQLKGQKIVHVHSDTEYGRETTDSTGLCGNAPLPPQSPCCFDTWRSPCLIRTQHHRQGDETWRRPPNPNAKTAPSPSIVTIRLPTRSSWAMARRLSSSC